jgi:hypothetical protein
MSLIASQQLSEKLSVGLGPCRPASTGGRMARPPIVGSPTMIKPDHFWRPFLNDHLTVSTDHFWVSYPTGNPEMINFHHFGNGQKRSETVV